MAGINSFGFGGANGHCLLTSAGRGRERTLATRQPSRAAGYLVPLSARSPEALRKTARGEPASSSP